MRVKTVLSAPELNDANKSDSYFLSGDALSYQLTGKHNEGLLSLSEYLHYFDYLRVLTNNQFVLDGQAGFGNPLNTFYSVTEMENHGADIILINDQTHPSHSKLEQRHPEQLTEFAGKLTAAMDAHHSEYSSIWIKLDCVNQYTEEELENRLLVAKYLGVENVVVDKNNSMPNVDGMNYHQFDYDTQTILN
ncbi:hypothetical protein MOO44_08565 [Nicoliella spurrieriana]|uniref:Uncharacterized protein n=1 Tax=Nicoliella spurrieriana TaxID=2925830 RepID=A0A976RSQ8_9LACO|nr:hypothetical protein [Nicoliella spurrieriana]UQS86901.1 hypothetical protein MOO44_08565 [Nicoliella spurrieriana]